ncbi:hypothetical protein DFH06DRAFT_1091561 [Mycena polygramma]|nr:hypothetical protein DFH06DRAFT_1091561 [Mycena polygramma]
MESDQLGCRVYRHKGHYHVDSYNPYNNGPGGLGIEIASEIPRDRQAYKKWLDILRKKLDVDFQNRKGPVYSDGVYSYIVDEQLGVLKDSAAGCTGWYYEIDLDHEVFLVDFNPLFALNNMPPLEFFAQWIGFDSYGHRSYYDPSTPKQHIYDWKSQPPAVDDYIIDDYVARQSNSEAGLSISDLLGTNGLVGSCEATRIALYEIIIGRVMESWEIGYHVRVLETVCERSEMDPALIPMGSSMVQVALGPMLLGPEVKAAPSPEASEFSWLAPDICMRIATHLDDGRNLKKNILELVEEVIANRQPGWDTFGILFSFFHCVIVRVDPQNRFKSTAALQFLPSFYATSPSTPGIAAIGSLAYHCLDTPKVNGVDNTIHKYHFLHQVPFDVLEIIVGYLRPSELETLCAAAPVFAPAAESVLRFPHVENFHENYRLVEVIEDERSTSLRSKAFSTQVEGSLGPVIVVGKTNRSLPSLLSFDTAISLTDVENWMDR